jgi:putative Holliday junction resolvase
MTEFKPDQINGRILGLDLGDKRIGVAVTDESQIAIRPLPAIVVTNWKSVLLSIKSSVESFDAKAVVLGWPITLDGEVGERAEKVRVTGEKLRKSLSIPVYYQDERLTTVAADEILRESGVAASERKELVDSQSASVILADFLAARLDPAG